MPKRIQRQRTKGWRMPPNAVYVGRPTIWGNPFRAGVYFRIGGNSGMLGTQWLWCQSFIGPENGFTLIETKEQAVEWFRRLMEIRTPKGIESLRGKDLACWCKPGDACHADILLELANG